LTGGKRTPDKQKKKKKEGQQGQGEREKNTREWGKERRFRRIKGESDRRRGGGIILNRKGGGEGERCDSTTQLPKGGVLIEK